MKIVKVPFNKDTKRFINMAIQNTQKLTNRGAKQLTKGAKKIIFEADK